MLRQRPKNTERYDGAANAVATDDDGRARIMVEAEGHDVSERVLVSNCHGMVRPSVFSIQSCRPSKKKPISSKTSDRVMPCRVSTIERDIGMSPRSLRVEVK